MTEQESKEILERIKNIIASTETEIELKTRLHIANLVTEKAQEKELSEEYLLALKWVGLQVLTLRNDA
jgi:hypothetical protein